MSCCVQKGMVIVDRGESQGVMICPGGGGNSGQSRVTRSRVVFRRTW